MNQPSLPAPGRYNDPRIQQMVVDELKRNDINPEKFYFTSDDWMVSYDGQVPAWNSVFGVAPYRKDGATFYAECGVSQRFDAATGQWSEPAATIKDGLSLSEADFDAAPGSLGTGGVGGSGAGDANGAGGAGAAGAAGGVAGTSGASADHGSPSDESSSTILASSVPDLDGRAGAANQDNGLAGFAGPGAAAAAGAAGAADDERAAGLATHPAGDDASASGAETPGTVTPDLSGSDDLGSPQDRPASSQTGPRHAVDGDDSAADEFAADDATADVDDTAAGNAADSEAGAGQGAADHGASDSSDAWAPAGTGPGVGAAVAGGAVAGAAVAGASSGSAAAGSAASGGAAADDDAPEAMGPGGGSAVYGGDAINSREPVYDSASVDSSGGGNAANVAGYSLTVNEDGTAELRVPLGGQVTLRWDEK